MSSYQTYILIGFAIFAIYFFIKKIHKNFKRLDYSLTQSYDRESKLISECDNYKNKRHRYFKWMAHFLGEFKYHPNNECFTKNPKYTAEENMARINIIEDCANIFFVLGRDHMRSDYRNSYKILDDAYVDKFKENPFTMVLILDCILCEESPSEDQFKAIVDRHIVQYF